jgi:flagellar FliJ protein
MRKFVWRAQKVLDVKKVEEQRKKNELLRTTEELSGAMSLLLTKKALLREILEKLGSKEMMRDFEQRQIFFRYSVVNDEAIESLKQEIALLEKKQQEQIAEYMKIRQYNQGLEKLKEQARIKFYDEQEKIEQKQADEDTVMKYARSIVHS